MKKIKKNTSEWEWVSDKRPNIQGYVLVYVLL